MIYAGILAGGQGKRMGHTNMPKQFLMLVDKPIIIHTIEKFLLNSRFEKVFVGCVKEYMEHTKDIIHKYIGSTDRIEVCEGGSDRNGTIMNICDAIESQFGIEENDVIVTHDAVRPFLTHRIIEDNINAALQFGACDTIIPATDTIVRSNDGNMLTEIPPRDKFYQGQTPQSFRIRTLRDNYNALTQEEKSVLTDACKICVLKGTQVKVVLGEVFNIKVTTPYDLEVARAILKEGMADQ